MVDGGVSLLIGYELWEKERIKNNSSYTFWPYNWKDEASINWIEKGCRRNRFAGKDQTLSFGDAENELYLSMKFQVEMSRRQIPIRNSWERYELMLCTWKSSAYTYLKSSIGFPRSASRGDIN